MSDVVVNIRFSRTESQLDSVHGDDPDLILTKGRCIPPITLFGFLASYFSVKVVMFGFAKSPGVEWKSERRSSMQVTSHAG